MVEHLAADIKPNVLVSAPGKFPCMGSRTAGKIEDALYGNQGMSINTGVDEIRLLSDIPEGKGYLVVFRVVI